TKPSVVPVFVTRWEIPATFLGIIRHGQLAKQAIAPSQMAVGMLSRTHHHVNTLQALVHGVSPLVYKLSSLFPVLFKNFKNAKRIMNRYCWEWDPGSYTASSFACVHTGDPELMLH
ncbi:MAG: hypothetical protein ACK55Z_30610, partial [bacterium]